MYGGIVWLQNNYMDSKWLNGAREGANERVRTRDFNKELTKKQHYQWIMYPKLSFSHCVKYGDTIFLKNNYVKPRWLSGYRGGERGTLTRDLFSTSENPKKYEWIVKSAPGEGDLELQNIKQDIAHGKCVKNHSVIFLQNKYRSYAWLTGTRNSKNENVRTWNYYGNDHDNGMQKTYGWIVTKNTPEQTGSRTHGVKCGTLDTVGSWQQDLFTNADQFEYTFQVAVMEGSETASSETITESWEKTVTSSVSAGLSFKAGSAGASKKVSSTLAGSVEKQVSSAFMKTRTETTTMRYTFEKGGSIWQFVVDVNDICKQNVAVRTGSIVRTEFGQEPCCLPGDFKHPNNPHGPCREGPCTCSADVCKGEGTKS